jgi:hypothetical protein
MSANAATARFVYLYASKDCNTTKSIGKVDSKTMAAVATLGLWDHDLGRQRGGCDYLNEYWYKWDNEDRTQRVEK